MADGTNIEWTDATWNPIRGCSIVSAGCTNCYAMKVAHRFSGPGMPYEGLTQQSKGGPVWNGKVAMVPKVYDQPLRWQRPRRIFVNSMGDLFHESVDGEMLAEIFDTMHAAPQHIFQILTKRPERMRQWIRIYGKFVKDPLPNVWLGVSTEDQRAADERIPILLDTPAALRFISAEPLIGKVGLWKHGWLNHERGAGIDWVIVGGESGPKARPCDAAWIGHIVDVCHKTETPVFVKQFGSNVVGLGRWEFKHHKGGDMAEWPEILRVRQMPAKHGGA